MAVVFGILLAALSAAAAEDSCGKGMPERLNAGYQVEGEIYSPGYKEGKNYPNNLFCETLLMTPYGGNKFRLTFVDIDIETSDLCDFDALEIFDGEKNLVLCGNQTVPDFVSAKNSVVIRFRTDFMRSGRGFLIKYLSAYNLSLCGKGQKECRNRKCYDASQSCDGVDQCGDGTDEENCGHPIATSQCGVRPVVSGSGVDRIVGGREATPGHWPWQADLQLAPYFPNGHLCGGTLIASQWLVTAAHCIGGNGYPENWRVHLGNHHKFKTDATEQIRGVERIILYPGHTGEELFDFEYPDLRHDLALMKLNAPVKFTESVRPACLPKQDFELTPGQVCMGTGWGMTRGTGSNHVLKEVDLWIEPSEACEGDMGPIDDETMICVKNRKGYQDVCHGDSGGPLVCEMQGAWTVFGATSFGTAGNMEGGLCAMPESFSVYAKVAHKADWIHQQISRYS